VFQHGTVGALEFSVLVDVGHDEVDDSRLAQLGRHVEHGTITLDQPAVGGEFAITGVESDRDPVAPLRHQITNHRRVFHRGGPQNDPIAVLVEIPFGSLDRADPAAQLDGNLDSRANGGDRLRICSRAGASTVEIDHMQPLGSGLLPAQGGVYRIGVEDRFPGKITFDKADGLATTQVDSRIDDHSPAAHRSLVTRSTSPIQDARNSSPAGPLFSGWNCVPQTLSCLTTTGNSSP